MCVEVLVGVAAAGGVKGMMHHMSAHSSRAIHHAAMRWIDADVVQNVGSKTTATARVQSCSRCWSIDNTPRRRLCLRAGWLNHVLT